MYIYAIYAHECSCPQKKKKASDPLAVVTRDYKHVDAENQTQSSIRAMHNLNYKPSL